MIDDAWKKFIDAYTGKHHGELKQDIFALFVNSNKRDGFFVEFGAMDGLKASNTLLLEQEYGWTGIMSEPNPRYNTTLAANRRCKVDLRCISDTTGSTVKFQCADQGGWPGMIGHIFQEQNSKGNVIDVETITLNDLLDFHAAPKQIDFISVDTDGSEPKIMAAFDFTRHRANAWTIEHNQEPWREDIRKIMEANDYSRVCEKFSNYDDWYVTNSLLENWK